MSQDPDRANAHHHPIPRILARKAPMPNEHAFDAIIDQLIQTFQWMARCGLKGFDCSETSLRTLERWQKGSIHRSETLADVRADIGDCQRCALSRTRTHIVYGCGDPAARLVFVGEGPGYEEDQSGQPFVGAAGQLLNRIIEAMKLTRDQVYICNIVKCRPPQNRTPAPEEIETCLPFVQRQIAVIHPQVICALGAVAAQTLLQTDLPISRLRGKFHTLQDIQVMPTYHPAFLLRNPQKKREVWQDIQKIMQALGILAERGPTG
jgi:uracil-DNA glycosylase family 4